MVDQTTRKRMSPWQHCRAVSYSMRVCLCVRAGHVLVRVGE